MKPLPLSTRTLAALRLSSMSCLELSRCLSVSPESAGNALQSLLDVGKVAKVGHRPSKTGRPWNVWGIAA